LDHRGIPHVCLVEFRARLVRAGRESWLHERLLQVAKAAGLLGHRRVVDSTGISDCVLTQDTVSLIRSATRRCLARLGELDPLKAAACAELLAREDYDQTGKPEICWASAAERAALVNELFSVAQQVARFCSATDDLALRLARCHGPWVRRQEGGQRSERFFGSFLGDPVGAAGDDQGLHVVSGELHRCSDLVAQAVLAADGQDG
jgi:hypothetical protein